MEKAARSPLNLDWTGTAFAFGAMLVVCAVIAGALLRFPPPVAVGVMTLLIGGPLVVWRPYLGLLGFLLLMYLHPEQWFPQLESLRLPLLLACLTLAAWGLQVLRRGETFRWTPHLGWMVGFAATMMLSPSMLGAGHLTMALMDALRLALLFLLIQQLLNSKERAFGAVHWHLLLTVFIACLAIYGWWSRTGVIEDRGRLRAMVAAGGFDDPNDLAASLVIVVPAALLLLQQGASRLARFSGLAALGLILTGIFLCSSRGGLLALGVAVGAYVFLRSGWKGRAALVVAAALLIAAMGSLDLLSSEVREDDSAMGRVNAWTAGLRMFFEQPILGVGYESFGEHHPILAHNSFVQVLAEGGFLGALTWVGLNYWAILTLFRVWKSGDKQLSSYAVAVLAGLLASLTAAMFLSHSYRAIPLIPVALAASLGTLAPRRKGEADWAHYLAVPLITLAGAGVIYLVTQGLL